MQRKEKETPLGNQLIFFLFSFTFLSLFSPFLRGFLRAGFDPRSYPVMNEALMHCEDALLCVDPAKEQQHFAEITKVLWKGLKPPTFGPQYTPIERWQSQQEVNKVKKQTSWTIISTNFKKSDKIHGNYYLYIQWRNVFKVLIVLCHKTINTLNTFLHWNVKDYFYSIYKQKNCKCDLPIVNAFPTEKGVIKIHVGINMMLGVDSRKKEVTCRVGSWIDWKWYQSREDIQFGLDRTWSCLLRSLGDGRRRNYHPRSQNQRVREKEKEAWRSQITFSSFSFSFSSLSLSLLFLFLFLRFSDFTFWSVENFRSPRDFAPRPFPIWDPLEHSSVSKNKTWETHHQPMEKKWTPEKKWIWRRSIILARSLGRFNTFEMRLRLRRWDLQHHTPCCSS